jgi:TPR repeat protein
LEVFFIINLIFIFDSSSINKLIKYSEIMASDVGSLSPTQAAEELIDKVVTKSQKLKFVAEEQPKLSLIKENGELIKKIDEMANELEEQKEKITSASSSSAQVKKNLETLFAAMEECLEYFDELNNTTVMFITKPKLKRKALAITQSLRSKTTQLLTSVTLELLLSQGNPDKPAPIPPKLPLSDDPLTDAQEYVLTFYGLAGRPINYARTVELATTAATEEKAPRAMLILAKCLLGGFGTDMDNNAAQQWLEKASELGFVEAKVELAILLLKSMKNRKECCIRKLTGEGSKAKPPLGGMALVALNVIQQEKDRKDDDKMLERATELLIEAADSDYALADTYLGIISEESGDYEEASKFFSAGTRRGCADSMNRLGLLHYFGRGVSKAEDKAFALFSSAALAGNRDAYNNVGTCLEKGEGVMRSISDALRHYEMGATLGCPDSMYSLGYLYIKRYIVTMQGIMENGNNNSSINGGNGMPGTPYTPMYTPTTPYSSISPFTPHSNQSYNESSYNDNGESSTNISSTSPAHGRPRLSTRDKEELAATAKQGIRWLRRASKLGIIEASYQLGRVYQQGIGIPTDMNAAFMQFEGAALAGGHAMAAELAGDMKYGGVGTMQDLVAAANFYFIAAERGGRIKAMNSVGVLLETGSGTMDRQPQINEAAKWFFEASRRGSPEASINLALLLGRVGGLHSFRTLNGEVVTRAQVRAWLHDNVTVTAKYSVAFEKALSTLDNTQMVVVSPPNSAAFHPYPEVDNMNRGGSGNNGNNNNENVHDNSNNDNNMNLSRFSEDMLDVSHASSIRVAGGASGANISSSSLWQGLMQGQRATEQNKRVSNQQLMQIT